MDFLHLPTVPDYDVEDFRPLERLELDRDTKLYLGVIHVEDGVEGAARRIAAATRVRDDFGIATFCGLNQPSRAEFADPHSVDEIFEIHRQAADAGGGRARRSSSAESQRN